MGEMPYRGVFSLIALASLVMVVGGYAVAPYEPVYSPPVWGPPRGADARADRARAVRGGQHADAHPRVRPAPDDARVCCSGALAHLAANGDLRSVVLFGSFAGFAVVATVSSEARGKRPATDKAPRLAMDGAALVAGLVVAGLFAYFHAALFGMPVM